MAKIIIRDTMCVERVPGKFDVARRYEVVETLYVECPNENFSEVWQDLKTRGLIPDRESPV